ncbi:MAG: hypothetical protein JWM12_2724 [Ilumatobacteraceae bacterium]|nr:hypothetical protein [Ilumatobacteraceae bacterium]
MSAYLVVNSKISDQSHLDAYIAAVGPTLTGHDFKVLVATTEAEAVEGSPAGERLVIMEFPDKAALRAWYDSPAYREVKKLRLAAGEGFGVIAEGI